MTKERKDILRRKGAIVAWECKNRHDFARLCYLKAKAGKFSLMEETDGGDVVINPHGSGAYILDRKWKLPILIWSLSDYLHRINESVSAPVYLKQIDKVRAISALRSMREAE